MLRNALALGFAATLSLILAMAVTGQGGADTDGDGVPDVLDNCVIYANGPLAQDPSTPQCDAQEDADRDGYGNPCDTDVDQDQATSLVDVAGAVEASSLVSTDPNFDFNCDAAVGLDDVSRVLADAQYANPPGPSGLPCAGTVPCP